MPNWCYQTLRVKGSHGEINNFLKAIEVPQTDEWKALPSYEKEYMNINQLFPIPVELHETMSGGYGLNEDGTKKPEQLALESQQSKNIATYGYKDWYDWALANWDTKWGACRPRLQSERKEGLDPLDEEVISIYFESAWSPAVGLIRKVSELFPALSFGMWFTEEADFFAGLMTFRNGETVAEIEAPVPDYPEYPENDDDDEAMSKYEHECETLRMDFEQELIDTLASVMDEQDSLNSL